MRALSRRSSVRLHSLDRSGIFSVSIGVLLVQLQLRLATQQCRKTIDAKWHLLVLVPIRRRKAEHHPFDFAVFCRPLMWIGAERVRGSRDRNQCSRLRTSLRARPPRCGGHCRPLRERNPASIRRMWRSRRQCEVRPNEPRTATGSGREDFSVRVLYDDETHVDHDSVPCVRGPGPRTRFILV